MLTQSVLNRHLKKNKKNSSQPCTYYSFVFIWKKI